MSEHENARHITDRRWATVAEAAERADVHPLTIRRWMKAGRLTGYRAGPRLIRVDLNELNEMIGLRPTDEVLSEEGRLRARISGELAAAGYAHAAKFVLRESE